jgi:hypothetical protein
MILSDRAMWAEWREQKKVMGKIALPEGWVEIGEGD